MGKDVFNILQGRRLEGGSTITQQVAKNVLLTNEATVGPQAEGGDPRHAGSSRR